jgi:hypothetical protein
MPTLTFQPEDRPVRQVGLFLLRVLAPDEMPRLVDACQKGLREDSPGAALVLSQLDGPGAQWKVSVTEGEGATPHDCLLHLYHTEAEGSPHGELIAHLRKMDAELAAAGEAAAKQSLTYLTITSARLDEPARIGPFVNLVALFASALGATIVDAAGAVVTGDIAEWAECCEMSLQLERDMQSLRRK